MTVSLAALIQSLFQTFPGSRETQVVAAFFFSTALLSFYFAWKDKTVEVRRLWAGPLFAITMATSAYLSGAQEARSAIEKPANVYVLNLKGDRTKAAVLLRTFEKGILIWNMGNQTAELMRWDQVDGISHIVAFDHSTQACRLISRFCQSQVER